VLGALQDKFRARVLAWAEARQGVDPDPVTLHRRRVYIFPTRAGFLFGLMTFAMLMGSMNYSNSMGFVLTFTLVGLGLVAMHHTHRNLEGLVLRAGRADAVYAGQVARFHFVAVNEGRLARRGIQLTHAERILDRGDVEPGDDTELVLSVATSARGRLAAPRFGLESTYPVGLFRAWAWVRMDVGCIVYPRPAPPGGEPPPDEGTSGEARANELGFDDFNGLRAYRPGDSPRHVAWRASARRDELAVKQFTGLEALTRWLDWSRTPEVDAEARLERLTRWVIDSHAEGETFGLRLPGRELPLAQGAAHRDRCLEALALHDGGRA
jgi:uncharacterized protein (DUF58 family)